MNKIIELKEMNEIIKNENRILVGGFGISGSALTVLDYILTLKRVFKVSFNKKLSNLF